MGLLKKFSQPLVTVSVAARETTPRQLVACSECNGAKAIAVTVSVNTVQETSGVITCPTCRGRGQVLSR